MEGSESDWTSSDVDRSEADSGAIPEDWEGTAPSREQLDEILRAHQQWLETGGSEGKRANLSGANLSGANLSGADLSGADLSGADLSGADLSGADLSRAYFFKADLSGAYFFKADLSGAVFLGANLHKANLRFSRNLSQAIFTPDDLRGALLPPSMERLLSMIPEEAEPEERTIPAGEASEDTSDDPFSRPSAEVPDAAMRTTVDIDDILEMEVRALRPATREAFERLVTRLRQAGLDGFRDEEVEEFDDPMPGEDGPIWRVRMGDDHRAFVKKREDGLEIVHVASETRLQRMRELAAND